MAELPEYVEIDGRLYEVVVAVGLVPIGPQLFARSHVDHAGQRLVISDEVEPAARGAQLERAICAALGLGSQSFRPVPILGTISTS
jgi:hypothetical protein